MSEPISKRQKQYQSDYDFAIMQRVPIVIICDLRNAHRATANLIKPFCPNFAHVMMNTMLYSITEMKGAVFGYTQGDEISFILRNDLDDLSEPWHLNKIQDIISTTASLTTFGFNKYLQTLEKKLDIVGDPIFQTRVYAVPNINEAANNLIWRQQDCNRKAVSSAAIEELSTKFGRKAAIKLLKEKTSVEKRKLLQYHCDIDFDDYYAPEFRRGAAVYKVPTLIPVRSKDETISKNKWTLNASLPIFSEDKDFILSILINAHDIYRHK
jgi:tRNA(His) 5'-end guanylyltransferase